MIGAAQEQDRTKVVQTKPLSSHVVLLPFITGFDPFEQIALAATTAKHFRRCEGQWGRWDDNAVIVLVFYLQK